jgi:hypothetical protein
MMVIHQKIVILFNNDTKPTTTKITTSSSSKQQLLPPILNDNVNKNVTKAVLMWVPKALVTRTHTATNEAIFQFYRDHKENNGNKPIMEIN